jgi:hypothetical protein
MWIPDEHWEHFKKTVKGWLDGPVVVKIKLASQGTRWNQNRKALSAIGYLTKAEPPQRIYSNPTLLYRPGRPILGRRSGMTRNMKPSQRREFLSDELKRRNAAAGGIRLFTTATPMKLVPLHKVRMRKHAA